MRFVQLISIASLFASACGGSQTVEPSTGPAVANDATRQSGGDGAGRADGADGADGLEPGGDNEFQVRDSDDAHLARGERPSEIEPTATEAAMRLFVVDPETGPIEGIVIKMTAPDGATFYTRETDSLGYAEVLVPAGQRYEMEYLSLGRRNTTASVEVRSGRNQNIRLTLRYRRYRSPPGDTTPRFVLDGVLFDTNRATIHPDSHARLDRVVEYMTHKPSARIRVAGHTDNVGNPRTNRTLSERRARAVRDYLVARGIDGSRIEAVGYGDEQPVASNDTEQGRAENRRIEAVEL